MNLSNTPGRKFRTELRLELTRRSSQNASYSLRAFAKSLNVSASSLSMVMSGKCPVTLNFIEKVGLSLNLKPEEVIEQQTTLLKEKSDIIESDDFEFIPKEQFEVIKDWYHYAILNLMRVKGFKPKAAWISKRLGISLGQAQEAITNLQTVGMLGMKNGEWVDNSPEFTSHTNNKEFNQAAKENQKQLFEKASKSIDQVDFEKRNHTGATIAVSTIELDEVKEFITEFREKFIKKFDKAEKADEVYHLSVALFPLSK